MNLKEGTRRLALLLGVAGAIACGFASYLVLQPALDLRARHNKFEQLANSDVVRQERKNQGGWVSVDPKTGEQIKWDQEVNKGCIKTIHWTAENEVEGIDTVDGQYLYKARVPTSSEYLLGALIPVFGFLIPWGLVRAIAWVGAGFVTNTK